MGALAVLPLIALLAAPPLTAQRPARRPPRPAAAPYTTPLSADEMKGKQAVVTTTAGVFVIALRPDLAPNHAGYFIKLAREGAYTGTIFHRVIRL
ncbi:MAG: peptidylprolyl isomerase, partial [Acidobacteriota bacterium]